MKGIVNRIQASHIFGIVWKNAYFFNLSIHKYGAHFDVGTNRIKIKQRNDLFEQFKQAYSKKIRDYVGQSATVKLRDGKTIQVQAFKTTPYDICKQISKQIAQNAIVARVKYTRKCDSPFNIAPVDIEDDQIVKNTQGQSNKARNDFELWDLTRPLEGDCILELLTFDEEMGREVFWHSSAHLLGQSLQNIYGAWLCHGPPLEKGFFYDSFLGQNRVSQADYEAIEKDFRRNAQQKQQFQRILLSKQQSLQLFAYNPFKKQLINNKVPDGAVTSAYRCGNLIDLCTGPHLPSADRVRGFKVTKNSSAYWLGRKQNDDLQRVYAISFPKQSQLQEYLKQQQEMAKRDHRTIGPKQKLFNFTPLAPGCALFYPHGTTIYNRLVQLMRSQYSIRGYSEVISPNIYNSELWKMSGHYFKYKENMFLINEEPGEEHGLKPMNCPGHCIMFDLMQHSYRDLPIRMADFGVLHRNQLNGALSGLTRVRRFQQDDAHIFCRADQIQEEILGVLDLLDYVYSVFGFKYVLELSTRPQKYLGDIKDWDLAQEQLKNALRKFGREYRLNEGDGAFYGPKIDVKLFDAFGREHQCGTCQLDFQLPSRFNLQYRAKEVKQDKENGDSEGKTHNKDRKNQRKQFTAEQIEQHKREKNTKKPNQQNMKQESTSEHICEHNHEHIRQKREQSLQQMQARYAKIGHLKTGFVRPVIIHRAIFGSLQRFIAILCEHTGGKWDFWISPRQIQLIPMGKEAEEFTEEVYNTLLLKGYSVNVDRSGDTFNKKIMNAQKQAYNYIGVIGKAEIQQKAVNLRRRDQSKQMGKFSIYDLLKLFEGHKPLKSRKREQLQKRSLLL